MEAIIELIAGIVLEQLSGGGAVLWGLVALAAAACLVFVILGHRKNWPEGWV